MKKRLLSWLLVLTMVISLIPSTLVTTAFAALAAGSGVDISRATPLEDGAAEITTGGAYTIGASRTNALKVTARGPVTLVLEGVTIATATSPIELADGAQVTLVVKDGTTNVLTCTATDLNAANSGKTAGILVPETASLTIDRASGATGTGKLTVTGGYGGAGIGGAAAQGYTKVQGTKGGDGGAGSNGKWAVTDIMGKGGAKGAGGEGGLYGQSATNAGTITINAGTVKAVGGEGGAGIGGGRGGDGQIGKNGNPGGKGTAGKAVRRTDTDIQDHHHVVCGATGSSGGGGAGGNGGNGGTGGTGGTVTINGGTVTAEGTGGAAGIGGGAGGKGGAGGNGNTGGSRVGNQNKNVAKHYGWNDIYWYPGFGGAGGNGEGGKGGVGGAGGDGGTLTITGGKVQSNGYTGFGGGSVGTNGQKGSGTRSNGNASTDAYFWWEKGGTNRWADEYCGEWRGNGAFSQYSRAAGNGGNGGTAAAAPTANANGAAGTLSIKGSSNNVDFVSNGGGNLTNGQPTDKNKDPLYRVELTVWDLEKDSTIKDANVYVTVPASDNSKVTYTYKTVSEENGKAVLWLPAGNYTLEKKAVNHAALGSIPKDSPVTLTVEANNNNTKDVMIGVPVHVTVEKGNKVYFAQDSENPLNIRVDTSEVNQTITSVKWFRETIKDNEDTKYAPTNTGNKEEFDKRYGQIADGNKGTLTNPTEKVYSLPINQNGRYWVEIEYESNGVPVKLVKGLTVSNIYRSYPIEVNSYTLNNGKRSDETGYQPLKTAAGTNYNANYGFPWDLNGYTPGKIQPDNLLKDPPLGWDEVSVFALSSEVKWKTAAFGSQSIDMPMNASQSGYEPHKLTLDRAFLANNTDADDPNDPTKFTIVYQPRGGAVTDIAVEKVIDGKVYDTNKVSYNDAISEETLDVGSIPGYKVSQVLIYRGNTSENGTLIEQDGKQAVKITNIHGTKDDPENTKIKKVRFIYTKEDGYTVNIVLKEQGTDVDITDLAVNLINPVTADKGQNITVNAPSIPNYKLVGGETSKKLTAAELEAAGGTTTVTFYYQKAEADLITITVKGVTNNGAGGEKQLYSFSKNERKSTTEVVLDVLVQEGYRVKSVTPDGGAPIAGTVLPDGSMEYKLAPGGKNCIVTVVYEDNMADVTVNAYYKGTRDKVDGFTPFKVKAEIGKPYTYGPLTLDGHDWDGITPALTVVPAQGGELNYYFTRKSGNVTYQLVKADDTNQVLITKTESVDKGAVVHTGASHAPKLENWTLKDEHANGGITGVDGEGKYDGVTPVTVTYEAVPKTNTIEITRYDADTNAQIPLTAAEIADRKSLTLTKETGHVYTISKADYQPVGYTISGSTETKVYVPDDGNPVQVNLYYRNQAVENVEVKLVYGDADTVFQTFQMRRTPGTELLVDIPDLADKGYKRRDGQTSPVTVPANKTEVVLEYDLIIYTVNVELKDDTNSQNITLNDPSFKSSYTVRKSESLTVTAPSIKGYTLVSDLAVTKTADDIARGDTTITFRYQKTTAAEFVTHTLVLVDQSVTPNAELARYTSLVEKQTDGSETIYYAPAWDGYQVDAPSKKASNAQNDTVKFYYTKSAATITIHFVDANGSPITVDGSTKKVLTGYEKNQTVMIAAPYVGNYALAGLWDGSAVQAMNGVTHTVQLDADQAENEVTFAYAATGNVTFTLRDAGIKDDTKNIIQVINGTATETYATADGGKLNLSADGWTFKADHEHNTSPFKTGEAQSVRVDAASTTKYNLYYTRDQRNVTYAYSDVTDPNDTKTITWTDGSNPATADVGSQLIAVAPQIPGYTPVKLRYSIPVGTGTDAVAVTFAYTKKQTGKVTVEHVVLNDDSSIRKTILSYVSSGSLGEWFKAEALTTDADGLTADKMYKFAGTDTDKTQTVQIGAAQQTIRFVYEANYVTVKTSTSVDGTSEVYQNGIEVAKNTGTEDIPALTLSAPSKKGYLLKGITVKHGTTTTGSATTYPAGWSDTTNTLGLYGLTDDVEVVYHYQRINDNMGEFQTTVTVKDQYAGYALPNSPWTTTVTRGVSSSIAPKTHDGYTLKFYQVGDSGMKTVIANPAAFQLNHTFTGETGTVTFFYERTDDSAVVPGPGNKLGDDDDVIIPPKDGNSPTIQQPSGNVEVPAGGAVITPGGTVFPPDGSVVTPGGVIVLPKDPTQPVDPDNPGTGGTVIDPNNPSGLPDGWFVVTYNLMGGIGTLPTQVVQKDGKVQALDPAAYGVTAPTNKTFDSWNTDINGLSKSYPKGTELMLRDVTDTANKTLTLFAQWIGGDPTTMTYHALIRFDSNNAGLTMPDQRLGSDASATIMQNLNPSTMVLTYWSFGGWNTASVPNDSSTMYADGGLITVTGTKDAANPPVTTLYAQWYKVTNGGASITVPGQDNTPNTDKDVTANGNGTQNPKRDETTGNIDIPKGGSVTVGGETIALPDGGILKPDGTVIINRPDGNGNGQPDDGTITVPGTNGKPDVTKPGGTSDPDAKVFVVTYQSNNNQNETVKSYAVSGESIKLLSAPFTWTGYTLLNWKDDADKTYPLGGQHTVTDNLTLDAQWAKKNTDGSIELPGQNGKLPAPDDEDNVIVTPDKPNGTLDGPKDDGSVEVKRDEATVTRPDPQNPGKKEDIKVPEGTIVKPDGTIELPDGGGTIKPGDKLPNGATLTDYVTVTYEPGDGTGNTIRQLVKKNVATGLLGKDEFAPPANKVFDKWTDGQKFYEVPGVITTDADLTLTARWRDADPGQTGYPVTITFHSGTQTDKQKVVGANKQFTATLRANPFFAPTVDWTFMGWTTDANGGRNGTFYSNSGSIELDVTKADPTLYAIWHHLDQGDGEVTLPGKDLDPTTPDGNVKVQPGTGNAPVVKNGDGEGYVEAGSGNTIVQPGGTIATIEGTVKVYPDGTVEIPAGSKVVDKNGNEVSGPAIIDPDGSIVNPDPGKPRQDADGNIKVPGKDNRLDTDDDVIVRPDDNGKPTGKIDPDTGDVTINPGGADVSVPGANPPATREEIKVPEGTVIKPDGTIILPDGKDGVTPGGGTIPGGSTVDPDGTIRYKYTIRYVDRQNGSELRQSTSVMVAKDDTVTIDAKPINGYSVDKESVTVIGGDGNYTITFTYTRNSGGTVIVPPSNPSNPSNPSKPSDPSDTNRPTSPSVTGVSKMLESENHIAYMGGYGNGMFGPNDQMTRAQVAQMFYNLLKDKNIAITVNFSDVQGSDWYATAVNTLASLGIIRGVGDGVFDPNRSITRAEFATIALRFADKTADGTNPFTDVASNDWYYFAVLNAVGFGWITGYSDGTFRPNASITRAEVATIVNRMLDRNADHDFVNGNATAFFVDVPSNHWAYYNIMEATTPHTHTVDRNGNESWGKLQ